MPANVVITLPNVASSSVGWPNLDSTWTRNVTIDCATWLDFVFSTSIASVSLTSTAGVTISSLANTPTTITFQQSGGSNNTNNAVVLSVTTDTGRTETISFEIPLAAVSGAGTLSAIIGHSAISAGSTEYQIDVTAHGAKGDGVTNDRAAFATAIGLAAARAVLIGAVVNVLVPAATYAIGSAIPMSSMVNMVGQGKPVLKATGSTGTLLSSTAGQFSIENMVLDGNSSAHNTDTNATCAFTSLSKIVFRNVDVINPTGGLHFTSCDTVLVDRCTVTGSKGHGVYFNGTHDSEVRGSNFQSLTFFGVILTNGCYRNLIQGNKTTANGIELVGITQDSYENRIVNNHAEGTGDNGISCTGYKNIIIGNICKGCQGNGIEVYGERNVVVGNHCLNNAQGNAGNSGWRAGIAIQGAFGGVAQYNTITGNTCDDDQASPTQIYGIWIGASGYTAWAAGQTISGASVNGPVYRYNGANLYKTTGNGTTGSTAPTHTTGTVSDGTVSWIFVRTAIAGAIGPYVNEIAGNNIARAVTSKYLDASGATGANVNEISASFQTLVLPSTINVSAISNAGGLATVGVPVGSYTITNGSTVTCGVSAPNVSGGQQATVSVASYILFGFGSVGAGGTGYAVNDIVTMVGGTPTGTACKLKVLTVDGSGAILTFTSTGAGGGFTYSALPPTGNNTWSGGTGTGFTTANAVWHVNAFTITAAGSGYSAPPTVTLSPITGTPTITTTTSATMTLTAGAGQLLLDTTGTKLGVSGTSGSGVFLEGGLVDTTGVRVALTAAQNYSVPANCSLVRFTHSSTIASATATLPTALADGHVIQINNYTATITAFTFSPAVGGWTNGNPFNAGGAMRVRWDSTDSKWYREQ